MADEIGLSLRVLRLVRGKRLEEVACGADICVSVLSDYERGKKAPAVSVLTRILAALDFSLDAFADTSNFLASLKERAYSVPDPEESRTQILVEVQRALEQSGRGLTRLIVLVFRVLLRRADVT